MRLPVFLFTFLLICIGISPAHATSKGPVFCAAGTDAPHQLLYFFDHELGYYNVHLSPTLIAIRGNAVQSGNTYPYFAKPWRGPIQTLCPQGGCYEFTVYPNQQNFTNSNDPHIDIMQEIMKITGQHPNRGMVRIITDQEFKHYVYTTDHESSFCGPYNL